MKVRWLLGIVLALQLAAADLAAVKAEPNPDKRYWLALLNADGALSDARRHYDEGRMTDFHHALEEARESVDLCDATLRGTGKDPRKSPKNFKRAELKIRELLRRVESLRQAVSVDDRTPVEKLGRRMEDIHQELVADIVGRNK